MDFPERIAALQAKVREVLERRRCLLDQAEQRLRSANETLNASRRRMKVKSHDPRLRPAYDAALITVSINSSRMALTHPIAAGRASAGRIR